MPLRETLRRPSSQVHQDNQPGLSLVPCRPERGKVLVAMSG